ncbi:MAG: Heme exporter protein C [Alphaproteobacteria bacterium MarineAlpha5_Bin8]|nr:MAG: Heme exporter protein C [Alphaproteobacteria bacterium MarineAlpha5_Bin7]PPR46365.1 MAG: Heme exporter protein C [Alphaproteobacteria bacterium MarineAlpha5_Bin8]PPR54914.1 MAG: Heme exporter protein C [Alphaproteobacteria bacterium MarineAlpha5_Bin6]|tara:strand:- start:669 stop:1367 length:699 start_codon:yes stop_codon:yes gene_type:complete
MIKIFINPGKFINFANFVIKPLIFISIISFIIGLIFALYVSPDDYQQGSTVRIMYIHVPSAWLAMLTFLIMTIYSIIALAFKTPFGFIVNSAVAPIGATFTFICLFTGSLWGKPMWGTWWVWDARLTSVALLFVMYLIIIFLKKTTNNINLGEKITSIFIIICSINLPIIKFSVDWWNTLHQPASISKISSPSIDPSMMKPLFIMTIFFISIGLLIAIIRIKAEILERKKII